MADFHERLQDGLADRYRLERELGRGGMATVFLAHDLRHDRPVALKVLHPELAATLGPERFQREIKLAARLQHPHILTVHDSGETDGLLWFTMPFVEGESLRDRLRREGQLSVNDAIRIATDAARALGYAHCHGVVHRDIKPENLLVTTDGSTLVADFGIARALSGVDERLTQTGISVGTPAYMSPEQAAGDRNLDARSDIYSLGCVLYEMLAGEPPYTGPGAQSIIAKRFSGPAPLVRRVRPAVPEWLEQVITKTLAPLAADRFGTAAELDRALVASAASADSSTSTATTLKAGHTAVRRSHRSLTMGLTAALLLVVAGSGLLWQWSHRDGGRSVTTRLAVLPFDNQGAPEDEYFADGMTDAVRGKLSALPALQVTARQSSTEYKKSTKSLKEIGQELGVQYLLTATVRWEKSGGGSRVQVSPELVQVSTASTKWQQPFDAAMTGVFEVQRQIAGQVADALDLALGAKEKQTLAERPTQNLAAYDAFLRGEEAAQSANADAALSGNRALHFYQVAVTRDTAFALAWAKLAVAHAGLYLYGSPTPAEAEAAQYTLGRAEELAPNAPETFAARASYEGWVRVDWAGALAAAKAGLTRYPAHPDLVVAAGTAERSLGGFRAALEHFMYAQELDPRSQSVARLVGETLLYLRRWPEARRVLDQALLIAPTFYTLEQKAMTYLGEGDLAGARRVLATAPPSLDRIALAVVLAVYGDLYWVLDEQGQQAALAQPVSAFGNNRVAWTTMRMQLYHLRNDSTRNRIWADSAQQAIVATLRGAPDDAQHHALHGLALAYLGRKVEAIAEGKRGVALMPISKDAFNGTYDQHLLVRIYLLVGEPEKALDQLEPLLKVPYFLSPGWLRIDPMFAALRGNPRFERLVNGR